MSVKHRLIRSLVGWLVKAYGSGEKDARKQRLLRALGHDPERHTMEVRDGKWPGLRVIGLDGKPVAFYTAKSLKRRRRDPEFLRKWEAAG